MAFTGNSAVLAQSELTQVTIAERSDGEGYVLRYHLTEPPDSFRIARPSVQLVQLNIYGSRLSEAEIPTGEIAEITDIDLFDIENGVGTEIYLNENSVFTINTYPDVNGRDLLVSLENSSNENVLAAISDSLQFTGESSESGATGQPGQEVSEEMTDNETVDENADMDMRIAEAGVAEKRVTIGVVTGLSLADVKGNAFISEVRSGISFGLAVGVRLPWELPFNIGTGVETGIFYAQKGFENAEPDFLNAEIVEFDYMEVPILAKFSYPLIEKVSPYLLLGPSLGFNVSAERVRTDESRADLDDQTASTDLSLIVGGGLDVKAGGQILTLQVKGGLSFFDVFKTVEESPSTDFFKHRYVALELIFRL